MAWHEGGLLALTPRFNVLFIYPLMPWLGLITAGYALGPVFRWEATRRQRFLWLAGGAPLFFYLVHIALIHALSGLYFLLRFGALPGGTPVNPVLPPGYAPSLPVVYAAWLSILLLMAGVTTLWRRRPLAALA